MFNALFARALSLLLLLSAVSTAEDSTLPWLNPASFPGALLICSESHLTEDIKAKFRELAGDRESRIAAIRLNNHSQGELSSTLPDAVIHSGPFDAAARDRLLLNLTEQPNRIGFSIPTNTGLTIIGRRLEVLGDAPVSILLAASPGRPLREFQLHPGVQHDWTMLRRAALERAQDPFPPLPAPPPIVEHGSLVIVGGGAMTREITDKFLELAGGPDAPIVLLPIAAGDSLSGDEANDTRVLNRAGATHVKSLRARTRAEVESPEFAAALSSAKGVWFNGGRQWRFVDAYMGTKAEELFRDVLRRGGVIGGSSAGASIQSQYMPRGSPLGNLDMMAEGYERGLAFLPGAAVDQHFTQRKRHSDMTALMRRYPQLLGIGIDEGTALIVQGSTAQILGRGHVHFYNYLPGPPAGPTDYTRASPGQRFDLIERALK